MARLRRTYAPHEARPLGGYVATMSGYAVLTAGLGDLAGVDAPQAVADEADLAPARLPDLAQAIDGDLYEPVEAQDLGPAPAVDVVAAGPEIDAQADGELIGGPERRDDDHRVVQR